MSIFRSQSNRQLRDRIVSGGVTRTVWWLSWPTVITMLLQSANVLIDAFFVGRLGAAALSGVGLSTQIMIFLMAVATAVSVGATALVARFVGSQDHESAEKAARQSILACIFISLIFGVAAYLLGPAVLRGMGASGEDLSLGIIYLHFLLLGITPFFLMIVLTGIYRGVGDMVTPLVVMLIATVVAVLGDYLLIFGIGPFPRLGVAGAGIASSASRVVAMLLFLLYLPYAELKVSLGGPWRPDMQWFRRILVIGTPAGLQGVLRTSALMLFFTILRHTPDSFYATAALTIGLRIESLAFMPGFAFSTAATSMVGQNLGAQQKERAERSAWSATWQSVVVTGVMGITFIIFAYPIARLFTQDPKVLPLAAQYLQINGISEPFLAMAMVLTGALQGAGETKAPAWATIITQWIIRLPLTYYLAVTAGLGALGAWISMSGTTVIGGLVMLLVFRWSRWQEIEV